VPSELLSLVDTEERFPFAGRVEDASDAAQAGSMWLHGMRCGSHHDYVRVEWAFTALHRLQRGVK
jgi:hypothetical protein